MKKQIIVAATAAFLSLPLALHAADKTKKKDAFVAADTDGNGTISPSEYAAAMKGKIAAAAAQAKFAELDLNKDGALSREEFSAGNSRKKAAKMKPAGN